MKNEFTPEYNRRLPHFLHPGATFFVTFRLYGSLPKEFLEQLRETFERRKTELLMQKALNADQVLGQLRREYFYAFDKALDACEHGVTHLKDPRIAHLVAEQVHRFDSQFYRLIGFTIMPNHVHALMDFSVQRNVDGTFDRAIYKNLDYVMDRIKGASARYANIALDQVGQHFWQEGFYDRYIRDSRHMTGAIHYLKQNAVSAKLCDHWMEFPFIFIHEDFLGK